MEPSLAAFPCNLDRLWESLAPCGQRRLLFLLQALGSADPRDALELAREMESFVLGTCSDGSDGSMSCRVGPERALRNQPAGSEGGEPSAHEAQPHDRAERLAADGPELLSRGVPRNEFLNAIRAGATNHQLAQRFGLTLRQANGLRIGLARRKTHASIAAMGVTSDRLERGEELVGQKTGPHELMDEVVRFLRQTGDIVVRSGENYLVNTRYILTARQLVERANRKRMERGRPGFGADRIGGAPPPSQAAAPVSSSAS
jgi:hypothetical protein